MRYLDLLREQRPDGEKSEESEKSLDAAMLKTLIVATVTVAPDRFDRARYERLAAAWNAAVAEEDRRASDRRSKEMP